MNIVIQPATLNDIPALLEFEQGVINAERPFDSTLVPGEIKYYDLEMFINSPDVELLVAKTDMGIVASGYARIMKSPKPYFDYDNYAYLGFMYVLPQYRGKGINEMIINSLKAWVRAQGLIELRLQVYSDNKSAIKAYEKVGFKKDMIIMRIRLD
jgi:GNAT superfamily N-acetyltransferase